eukprot:27836_1
MIHNACFTYNHACVMLFYTVVVYLVLINECSSSWTPTSYPTIVTQPPSRETGSPTPQPTDTSWTLGSASLPRGARSIAVAYDDINDTILLFGGFPYGSQFVTFKDHQFIDVGETAGFPSSRGHYGHGKYYTKLIRRCFMDGGGLAERWSGVLGDHK